MTLYMKLKLETCLRIREVGKNTLSACWYAIISECLDPTVSNLTRIIHIRKYINFNKKGLFSDLDYLVIDSGDSGKPQGQKYQLSTKFETLVNAILRILIFLSNPPTGQTTLSANRLYPPQSESYHPGYEWLQEFGS